MAKNFSSVLEALKGAGAGKQAEVERSYAANCEWLLQQFKAAQASFAELKADDKAEQQVHQSTAKSRSQHTGEAEPAVSTDPHVTEQQDAERQQQAQEPEAAPSPGSAGYTATRNTSTRTTRSAQQEMDTKAVHQFPSPPKARTRGGRRAQTAKEAPAAAAKPPRTRRGAKKQAAAEASAADAEHTDAEPAQLMKPLQDAESADAEAGSAEDQIRTGNAVMTSHDSKESPSLQPGRQQLPDSRAAPTVDSASTQHPTTDSAKAVQSPPSVQISPPTSLTKSSKRKDSPNALSPDPKRQHQEPASAQAAHKPFDSLEPSSAAVGELADQASPMMVDNGNQAPQAQDANLGSSDQHALHSSELLAARSHSAAPASADMVDKTGLSIAVHADLPPEASSEQPELVASVSDSEPEAAADSPASAGQTLSSPVPDHPAREQYGADADKSSPPAPDPPAAQQDDTTHAEPSVEVISPDQVAEGSPQPVPVIPDDLTADTEQHASPPAALSILPAQTEVAKDEAASAQHTQLPVANNATEINLQTAAATALPAVPEAVPAKQALSAVPGNAPEAGPGLGKNLVSAIRSFLPGSKAPEPQLAAGKKPVKVKALEAAEAARRKEAAKAADRLKQKGTLDKQRAERVKAKQEDEQQKAAEEARRRQEAIRRREEEATQRRLAKEEAEKRDRLERQSKLEASKLKKKAEEAKKKEVVAHQSEVQLSRPPLQDQSGNVPGPLLSGLLAAPARAGPLAKSSGLPPGPSVAKMPLQHILGQQQNVHKPAAVLQPAVQLGQPSAPAAQLQAAPDCNPHTQPRQPQLAAVQAAETYQISPYRGDDSDSESSSGSDQRKPIPDWARGRALMQQLASQVQQDPDEVFQQHRKTCSLDEVFGASEDKHNKKKDLHRRTSSGNWIEDRVTWKEELNYKKAMGYV